MKLSKNVGAIDRLLRSAIALVILYSIACLIQDSIACTLLGLLFGINLFAIVLGNCPLYSLIGYSSRPRELAQHPQGQI